MTHDLHLLKLIIDTSAPDELNVRNAAGMLIEDDVRRWGLRYENYSMANFPKVEEVDPIEYLHFIKKLNDVLWGLKDNDSLLRFYNPREWIREGGVGSFKQDLEFVDDSIFHVTKFDLEVRRRREDVKELEKQLDQEWEWFARERPEAAKVWKKSDELTKEYLLGRACDLVRYGEELASSTFPEPGRGELKRCASSLVWFFKEIEKRDAKQKEQKEEEEAGVRIGKECEAALLKVPYTPPSSVVSRPLKSEERNTVLAACEKEINENEQARNMLAIVRQFALFCRILAKPENHIRVPSGQYIEVETPLRTEADMVAEKIREIIALSKYTAYAKLFSSSGVWKGQIKTRPLPEKGDVSSNHIAVATGGIKRFRSHVREEMLKRQQDWRRGTEPPPIHS